MKARVLIRPKEGILDPQGQAVERALPALGFSGVAYVHVGWLIELDVEDASQASQMCERLLANPLVEDYEPGRGQPSFDKQYVRDWASASGWDKSPPAPELPDEVVQGTRARYVDAYERIADEPFERWLERSA